MPPDYREAESLTGKKFAKEIALQILDGLEYSKIPRYADEMDPVDAAGERAELEYEQVLEKRELDWLKTNKFQ